MAKLGFKDILMKYLKKDEAFKVKYAMNPNQKIAVATYNDKAEAEKFVSDIIKKGGKAILTQEDAPANATGTAVAGTGDDSSTVVVKKKKDQQKKLMKRMGITEAINRAIPDLEYPKDEIRERVNQLKELASIEESAAAKEIDRTNTRRDSMDYKMYKKSAELLRKKDYKALGKHIHKSDTAPREYVMDVISKKEPATFKKIYGNQTGFLATMKPLSMGEDLDAQPQDKDVKKVKGTQPKKYYKKLDKDTKKKRAAFFKKKAGTYKKSDDDDDYKAAPGDEKAKTKPSTFTKKFKKMYGDNYGYTAMHAKPVAKLNPLRRKDEGR